MSNKNFAKMIVLSHQGGIRKATKKNKHLQNLYWLVCKSNSSRHRWDLNP